MDTRRRFLMLDNIDSGNNTPDYSDYYTIDLNDEWKKSDNINKLSLKTKKCDNKQFLKEIV